MSARLFAIRLKHLSEQEAKDRPHLLLNWSGTRGGNYCSRVPLNDIVRLIEAGQAALRERGKQTGYTNATYVDAKKRGII